ncbi:NAD(+) kinase [[Candida] railenensis]|uniref:NAD(+) kinase n=1 Tax=[Candida] railenensis TaxID=45579 RepID=A0A9P0QUJ5_9ASCO|nr:NAD(+) kinase [[Candida] railenensis]
MSSEKSSDKRGMSSRESIDIPKEGKSFDNSYRKTLNRFNTQPSTYDNGGNMSPPSVADTNPPVIHNKLFVDQVKLRLDKLQPHSHHGQGQGHQQNHNQIHHNNSHLASSYTQKISPAISSNSSCSVLSKLKNEELKPVRSHTELAETANGVRMLARNLAKATIQLDVRAIMVVTKARDNSLIYLTREVAEWLLCKDREIVVYVDSKLRNSKRFDAPGLMKTIPRAQTCLKYWDKSYALRNPEQFDLVVTLGGDGTVLYVSNLFQRVVPPVLSFSLGSLGFLTNFKFDQFRDKMNSAVESGVRAYLRMRFTCRVHKADGKLVCEQQVLNELVVDRGPSPYVTQLELYGDGSLLTIAQADGLIIATPTGSTAYSLSAGGSLVHPGVSAISVTPICPHTLSFRPILLPDGMLLKVKVPKSSRATAWASFDGKVRTELKKGDYVTIQASPFPFPTVISSKTDYIDSVSRNLNWNVRETQKPFASLLNKSPHANGSHTNVRGDIGEMSGNLHIDADGDGSRDDDEDEGENSEGGDGCEDNDEEDQFDIDETDNDEMESLEEVEEEEKRTLRQQIRENLEMQPVTSSTSNTTFSTSSTSSFEDEDSSPYLPESGNGLSTPPSHLPNFNFEERTCYAHPNARISLRD